MSRKRVREHLEDDKETDLECSTSTTDSSPSPQSPAWSNVDPLTTSRPPRSKKTPHKLKDGDASWASREEESLQQCESTVVCSYVHAIDSCFALR